MFPQELIDEIAGHAHDDKDTLLSLSLTSRSWNTSVLPLLFGDIPVKTDSDHDKTPHSLSAFLRKHPRIQTTIVKLCIVGAENRNSWDLDAVWLALVLGELPNLRELALVKLWCSMPARRKSLPHRSFSLRKLVLSCVHNTYPPDWNDVRVFIEVLSLFHAIDCLEVLQIPGPLPQSTFRNPFPGPALRVKHLVLRPASPSVRSFCELLKAHTEDLCSLSITDRRERGLGLAYVYQIHDICTVYGAQLRHLEVDITQIYAHGYNAALRGELQKLEPLDTISFIMSGALHDQVPLVHDMLAALANSDIRSVAVLYRDGAWDDAAGDERRNLKAFSDACLGMRSLKHVRLVKVSEVVSQGLYMAHVAEDTPIPHCRSAHDMQTLRSWLPELNARGLLRFE